MASDLSGVQGQNELMAFARKIGLNSKWLQKSGQYNEHFDLFGSMMFKARTWGAKEISRKAFGKILILKQKNSQAQNAKEI